MGSYLWGSACQPCSTPNCLTCANDRCSVCSAAFELEGGSCQSKSLFYIYLLAGGITCFVAIVVTVVCCYLKTKREARVIGIGRVQLRVEDEPSSPGKPLALAKEWEARERKATCEEICSFCLEGRVDLEISCGHFYHSDCLAMWLSRHSDCPLCKRPVFGTAHRFCSVCLLNSFAFPAMLLSSAKGKIDCDSCRGVSFVEEASSLPENRLCMITQE